MSYTSRGTFWNSWTQFSVLTTLNLDFLCTSPSPTLRPNSASSVVSTLQGKIAVQAPIVKRSSMNQDMRFKAFERLSQYSPSHASPFSQESQVQGSISNGPWICIENLDFLRHKFPGNSFLNSFEFIK